MRPGSRRVEAEADDGQAEADVDSVCADETSMYIATSTLSRNGMKSQRAAGTDGAE